MKYAGTVARVTRLTARNPFAVLLVSLVVSVSTLPFLTAFALAGPVGGLVGVGTFAVALVGMSVAMVGAYGAVARSVLVMFSLTAWASAPDDSVAASLFWTCFAGRCETRSGRTGNRMPACPHASLSADARPTMAEIFSPQLLWW